MIPPSKNSKPPLEKQVQELSLEELRSLIKKSIAKKGTMLEYSKRPEVVKALGEKTAKRLSSYLSGTHSFEVSSALVKLLNLGSLTKVKPEVKYLLAK
jgi:hypothetical protein